MPVASPTAGAVDDEESVAYGCKDGCVTLGFEGRELLGVAIFGGNSLVGFSLTQASL